MNDDRYDINAVPEEHRKHLKRFGGEFENFVGVEFGGQMIDLRQTHLNFTGGFDRSASDSPKAVDATPLRALINLESLTIESCKIENSHILTRLLSIKSFSLFAVRNFSGYIPPNVEILKIEHSTTSRGYVSIQGNCLRGISYYCSDISGMLDEVRQPDLQHIELYGTPIHTALYGSFNMSRAARILSGNLSMTHKDVKKKVDDLRAKGVRVSFEYQKPYI